MKYTKKKRLVSLTVNIRALYPSVQVIEHTAIANVLINEAVVMRKSIYSIFGLDRRVWKYAI
jgi:hypothetical protein